MTKRTSLIVAICILAAGSATAADHKRKSRYTTLDPAACKTIKAHPDGNAYRCVGLPGTGVYFAEGDQRTFLSFGTGAATQRAATQSLGFFNTPFEGRHRRAAIEWRAKDRFGKVLPYATIVRYFVTGDDRRGQVLIVTRVSDRDVCHAAYIDALANTDAIVIARRIADEVAPTFDCRTDPRIEGTPGILKR